MADYLGRLLYGLTSCSKKHVIQSSPLKASFRQATSNVSCSDMTSNYSIKY